MADETTVDGGEPGPPAGAGSDSRAAAAERARGLLREHPWTAATERLTLWLVSPPRDVASPAQPPVEAWLAVDRATAQTLGADGQTLSLEGAIARDLPPSPGDAGGRASIFTTEALAALLGGEGRRAIEARWSLSRAELLADRLGRHDRLVAESSRSPAGSAERALRGAYLATAVALPALSHATLGAAGPEILPTAGEATSALARLACLLDGDSHPPLPWLLPAARETRLGRRLQSWFDDLAAALAGDQAAARRAAGTRDAVLEQARALTRQRLGERPWLRDPQGFMLSPRRS